MSRGDWNRVDVAFLIEPARIVYLQGNQNNILLWESPKTAQKVFLNTARCCGLNFSMAQFGTQKILGKIPPIFSILGLILVFNTRYSSRCDCNKSVDPGPVITEHSLHSRTLSHTASRKHYRESSVSISEHVVISWCTHGATS